MIDNEEDIKYSKVISTLQSLQKVNAPSLFEANLMRRINSGQFKTRRSFWDKVLLPSRLVPSSLIAVSVILILFFFNLNTDNGENPLTIDPKVREDLVAAQEVTFSKPQLKQKDSLSRSKVYASSAANRELIINKTGLNFRQIRLNADEKAKLNELKQKLKRIWSESTSK